jgi:4'-phosphopantetheinyl transferase
MPELLRKKIDDHSMYALWNITESVGELLGMIKLNKAEQELFGSFVAESRQKQWLAYRILIRTLLLPAHYSVEYDETGKPYLAGPGIHISVTHSGHLAAVILSSAGRTGIDIEAVKPKIERVKERYLSPEELSGIGGPEAHDILTLAWCAKEALYKMYGFQGLDFRENMWLDLPETMDSGTFTGEIRHDGRSHQYNLKYDRYHNHLLVYVLEEPTSQHQ